MNFILVLLWVVLWIGYTASGTQWILQQVLPMFSIDVEDIQGKLFDHVVLKNVHYRAPDFPLSLSVIDIRYISKGWNISTQLPLKKITQGIPQLGKTHGTIIANVYLRINPSSWFPSITGKIYLKNSHILVPTLGIQLRNINLHIEINEKGAVQLSGQLRSGAGILRLTGQSQLTDIKTLSDITLIGENIQAINTQKYNVIISPRMQVIFQNNHVTVRGSVLIPKALLKPIISTQYVTLSEDVEIIRIDDKKTLNQTPAFSWNAQIQLVLGRGVQLELYGLQGNLSGQLLINDYSGGIMTGKGIIYIKGGYNAHGQNLRVQRGKVIFNGGMVENPLLDIQATKQVKIMSASQPDILQKAATLVSQGNTTTVGISVTGSLKSRQTALFSDPVVLSQADILSYIVLDRPADQARKLDARLLLKAASAFSTTADPTEKLTHQLESSLGLSEINLEWVNKGTMAMPGSDQYSALTLGKALSSRLYVNYSIGVFEAIQTLKLRYLLTPRLSFQTETNRLGNSIDLLYTIESDR